MSKKKLLTGVKPTGNIHIGNYFGAIKPALTNLSHYNSQFFIADYHAITTLKDPQKITEYTYHVAASWLALGLDPKEVLFYRQSDIPEIFECMWILSCFANKGLLNRAHAYKAFVDTNIATKNDPDYQINLGLFSYPVLMAADILLFDAHYVPVGADQKQHVEIARDIAQSVNSICGNMFVLPEPLISKEQSVIKGIDGQKMSKNYSNIVSIFEPESRVKKQIMKIKTDSKSVEEPKNPEECLVYQLYKLLANEHDVHAMKQAYETGGLGYGTAKKQLLEAHLSYFGSARKLFDELINDHSQLENQLMLNVEHVRKLAADRLGKLKRALGVSQKVSVT